MDVELNRDAEKIEREREGESAIQSENYWGDTTGLIYNIVFVIGALMLYAVLYQSQLVPRCISVWGLLAAVALLIGGLLSVFTSISPTITLLIILPIAVQEMVMALWLIVKGFNPSAIATATVAADVNGIAMKHA